MESISHALSRHRGQNKRESGSCTSRGDQEEKENEAIGAGHKKFTYYLAYKFNTWKYPSRVFHKILYLDFWGGNIDIEFLGEGANLYGAIMKWRGQTATQFSI